MPFSKVHCLVKVCPLLFVVSILPYYACADTFSETFCRATYTSMTQGEPCDNAGCNVCNICTHGGLSLVEGNVGGTARRKNFPLRYGGGLFFSSVSGKANDYAKKSQKVEDNLS